MGGSSSKSKSTVIAEALNEVMVSSIQRCSNETEVFQELSVKGDGNILSDIQMNQVYSAITSCVNKTDWVTDLQTQLEAKLKQSADAQGVALLGVLGKTSSDVDNEIRNSIKNAVNVQTLSEMVNKMKQKQSITVEGNRNVLTRISLKQMNNNISTSTQELVGSIKALNDISSDVDQKAKSVQQDPIANLLSGLANLMSGPMMWVAIILLGGLIAVMVFLNTGAGQAIMDKGFDELDEYKKKATGGEIIGDKVPLIGTSSLAPTAAAGTNLNTTTSNPAPSLTFNAPVFDTKPMNTPKNNAPVFDTKPMNTPKNNAPVFDTKPMNTPKNNAPVFDTKPENNESINNAPVFDTKPAVSGGIAGEKNNNLHKEEKEIINLFG
jgi:hypothetical protein